jgi:hypothetical protein
MISCYRQYTCRESFKQGDRVTNDWRTNRNFLVVGVRGPRNLKIVSFSLSFGMGSLDNDQCLMKGQE